MKHAILLAFALIFIPVATHAQVLINEVDYDNPSTDNKEFIELIGPVGTSLDGYTIELVNGLNGSTYETIGLSGQSIPNSADALDGFDFFVIADLDDAGSLVPNTDFDGGFSTSNNIQNGTPEGVRLLKDGSVVDAISYEGQTSGFSTGQTITAIDNNTSNRSIGRNGEALDTDQTDQDGEFSQGIPTPGETNIGQETALPVELVAFNAQLDGNKVVLQWETASELNNAGFEVQWLSEEATPKSEIENQKWEALTFVEGYGTTEQPRQYSQRVDGLTPGHHRFRLKQVDYDGTFAYSPEIEVAVEVPGAYHLSAAYPNPFNPQTSFSLSVAQTQDVEVAVYDLQGREVALLHKGRMEAQTARTFRVEAHDLPSGLYLIRVLGEQFAASQSIMLVK